MKKNLKPSPERVRATWNASRTGIIVVRGEQVSEVRWDDKTTEYVPNEHLKPE